MATDSDTYDEINKPKHYNLGIETWDFIASFPLDYLTGNAIKYLTRFPHKGTPEKDLSKALAYISRLARFYDDEPGYEHGVIDPAPLGRFEPVISPDEYADSWMMSSAARTAIVTLVDAFLLPDQRTLKIAVAMANTQLLLRQEEEKRRLTKDLEEYAEMLEGMYWPNTGIHSLPVQPSPGS